MKNGYEHEQYTTLAMGISKRLVERDSNIIDACVVAIMCEMLHQDWVKYYTQDSILPLCVKVKELILIEVETIALPASIVNAFLDEKIDLTKKTVREQIDLVLNKS